MMKQKLFFLPIVTLGLTGCGVTQFIQLIDESTEAIHCNRAAVESDTAAIDENIRIIHASTETVKENGRLLMTLSE